MNRRRRPLAAPGAGILRLYPHGWRARYEDEVRALLEDRAVGVRDRLDLIRGALDAHLHPPTPSRLPGVMAVAGGGLWTSNALVVGVQPVPPDWPGYLAELLPFALVASLALLAALVGCWLRLGDAPGSLGRIAIDAAVAGHVAWAIALAAALAGLEYGAATAIASGAAAVGTGLVALALLRAADWPIAGLLAVTPPALLLSSATGWLVFGLAWTAVGVVALIALDRGPVAPPTVPAPPNSSGP